MPYYGKKRYGRGARRSSKARVGGSRRRKYTKAVYGRRPNNKMALYRSPWKNPLPQKGYFKLRFQDSGYTLTTAAALYQATRLFRGNSLYDPDYTGVGVQPYGFDNYCGPNAPFGAYKVFGSKIRVITHVTSDSYFNVRMCLFPSRQASLTYVEWEDLCQMPYCKKVAIENQNDYKNNLTSYVKTKQVLVDAGKGLPGEAYAAYYNSNPLDSWYWHIVSDSSIRNTAVTVTCDVVITYYAMLYKVDDINES